MKLPLLAALLIAGLLAGAAPALAETPTLRPDRFRTVYEAPKNPAHRALYERLKAAHTLETLREFLAFVRLPRILTLRLAGCDGVDNAWYDADDRTVTVCYEYLDAVRQRAPAATTADGVTPEGALRGPLLEVFLHEIGHALFDQLRIPILGREEDAADQLAAVMLLHQSLRTVRDTVLGVAWMYAQDAKGERIDRAALANVHGLSAQRFYNLLCIAYGAEPELFADLVDKHYLPEDRAETCGDEFAQVEFAIRKLMAPYIDPVRRDQVFARQRQGGKLRQKVGPQR
jgi:hypothetical protein